jgi:DNA relaxase NicK
VRFDAYSATLRGVEAEPLAAAVAALLGGSPTEGRGLFGYSSSLRIEQAGEVLALVLHGGRNSGVHLQVQGEDSVRAAGFLRSTHGAGHVVTRADVCEDLDGPGTWDGLFAVVNGLAAERGLTVDCRGDWVTEGAPLGRTFYVGAPSSAVRVRLYEKGKQLVATGKAGAGSVSPDWCRIEVQTRPEGESRTIAAAAAPEAFWGLSDWSRELARRAFGLDVERIHVKEVRDLDTHRSLRAMARQYAGVIARRGVELGSEDAALREVVRLLQAELRRVQLDKPAPAAPAGEAGGFVSFMAEHEQGDPQ